MKRVLVSAAVLVCALPIGAFAATKTYTVQQFDSISVAAGIELKAQVGPAQSIVAETDGGDFSDLLIQEQGGVLIIGRPARWNWFGWNPAGPHFKVTVTVPALKGLHASSSASAEVSGAITGDAEIDASSSGRASVAEIRGGLAGLQASSSGVIEVGSLQGSSIEAHASSSGRVKAAEVKGGMVAIHASSSGLVELSGACETLDAEASSSGRIMAGGLKCASVIAHASSGGGIESFASKSVVGHASSGGGITVAGKPAQVTKEESSGGSISIRD